MERLLRVEDAAVKMDGMVSWDEAEEELMRCVEMLGALGDREHGFLSAGRKSSMPKILRIEQSDYPDRPDPRLRLSARELRDVDAMLLAPDAMVLAIPEQHRALVGRVVTLKLWPEKAGGFRWEAVRAAMVERAPGQRVPAEDALRMRYERAIAKLSGAMARTRR